MHEKDQFSQDGIAVLMVLWPVVLVVICVVALFLALV
jgi:type II secretory pathway component PulK